MCCDDCMNRRRFLTMAAGGAAVAALAACGDGVISGVGTVVTPMAGGGGGGGGGGGPTSKVIKVGDFPDLASASTLVALGGTSIAVKRTGASAFTAFDAACTHERCLCSIVDNAFKCPCHFSEFDNDGRVTMGPAASDLGRLTTSYDAATDMLTIS